AFCIFTPQSKARSCWSAVEILLRKNLMFIGNADEIRREINSVRFSNKKSEYLVKAREQLLSGSRITIKDRLNRLDSPIKMREWLVSNVKGIGYKEASHFLRNIGYGDSIAILDRHILKNLKAFGLIKEIPNNLSQKIYMEHENKMIDFAGILEIPVGHLDFVFWYRETGEVFK
ncbi:MAG: N-glycosylase/DNA lyase, partial [Bacteroidetes bacterium]|nr:N-glycosylase/DNA lyase [Bacteroidota bacterium]